ncbi:hypothetical protein Halha_1602 [Halobacteroides halobius DSM 5150]|uniref:Uncharacterized protein n=1 Tax=Halobacteroides halobius (strain ATCC 35273 / DSM 5150 / MD-1) TaxID=748449 RepID=L0KAG8_HALHC|nr:hypothetical protein [Halobacteroides halobius]AGB41540.1 hypothetical protein Halha_1602 [Halobacteroides halobius DSM 5150]
MSDYKKQINQLKDKLDKANRKKAVAEDRLDNLKEKKKELLKQIEDYGIKPEELEDEIKELENKLQASLAKAQELLPDDQILDQTRKK